MSLRYRRSYASAVSSRGHCRFSGRPGRDWLTEALLLRMRRFYQPGDFNKLEFSLSVNTTIAGDALLLLHGRDSVSPDSQTEK